MNLSDFNNKNYKNGIVSSEVPKRTKSEPCMLGIDEAGRGPVLGPMVYAIAYCPISCLEELEALNCADSKTLTEKQREELFIKINDSNKFLGWSLEIHSPTTICNSMLRRSKCNLNEISHNSAIDLIKSAIENGVNAEEVYVDTVGIAEKYQSKLSEIFPDLKITVTKQADAIYPIVSAASICAKVARDQAISDWNFREYLNKMEKEIEYGSGYPNDPVTKCFLQEHIQPVFGYPQLVRFSWSTADKILEEKAVKIEWDDEDEASDTPSVLRFFKNSKKPANLCKSHSFFKDRCLTQAHDICS